MTGLQARVLLVGGLITGGITAGTLWAQGNPPRPVRPGSAPAAAPAQPAAPASTFNMDRYFSTMEEDVAVYDPASPWIYEGKAPWRKRVEQMRSIRLFLDLNQFNRTEVELGDMRIVTVDREIRRPEGSFTERNHGRITWVYLKQPDGQWFLWHDHTSEIPEDYAYSR